MNRAPEDRAELLGRWRVEEQTSASGWDWSELAARIHDEPLPWDVERLSADAVSPTTDVLDLGTGGGERLVRLADALPGGLPPGTTATEGWPPNVAVARAALQPYGVTVVPHAPPDPLPFPDDRFDLVLSRHMGFDPAEVARVLRPGGALLTQQVGRDDLPELAALFGRELPSTSGLPALIDGLAVAGMRIELAQEFHGTMTVDDVGAFVRYLIMVPWYAPADFGVDAYAELLLDLHEHGLPEHGLPEHGLPDGRAGTTRDDGPGRGGHLRFTQSRHLVRAVVPPSGDDRAVSA